jgi:hypothetical protein
MPKEVSKLIEDQDDKFFLREQVHKESCQEEDGSDEVQHIEDPTRHLYPSFHLMKMKLSNLVFLLHMKMKK